jgi:DNA-binding CsgD family transcriptional regulator
MIMPHKVASDLQERLDAVRLASGQLTRNRVALLRQMRRIVGDIRAARARLRVERQAANRRSSRDPVVELAEKYQLTPREAEVALLLAEGAPNLLIANLLRISEHTARHHPQHVLVKMGLHSRGRAAALIAKELG